jgi:hypothetical protein
MSIILTSAALAALYAQGIRPEQEIHLGAGYSRIRLSPYVTEQVLRGQVIINEYAGA